MYLIFIAFLFITLITVRLSAYLLHDKIGYGTEKEKSMTITGYFRRKTGYDVHHYHMGILLLLISFILIISNIINNITIALLGISTSLIVDQVIPILHRKSDYFSVPSIIQSIILHIIIAALAYIMII